MTPTQTITNHGRHTVVGWLILASVHGEDAAKQRVVDLWSAGSSLRRVSCGFWLSLPKPQVVRGPFPAIPVVQTPYGPSALGHPPESSAGTGLHLPTAGGPVREEGHPERPDQWLSLPFKWVDVSSLATPTSASDSAFEERSLTRTDMGVAEVDELGKLARSTMARLLNETVAQASGTAIETHPHTSRTAGWQRTLMRSILTPIAAAGSASQRLIERVIPPRPDPWRPQWFDRLNRWLDSWTEPALREKHEAYLQELVALFGEDDIDAALRRALPLGAGGAADRLAKSLSRRDNRLVPGQQVTARGGAIAGSESTFRRLRKQYRQTAQWLEERGEIPKAAFVLSDLLGDHLGAIRLCEKHDQFDIAAALGEMHDQPARAVANWVRHGDIQRAIDLARRTRCYSTAITLLEESHAKSVRVLRKNWADALYTGGEPLRAIEVLEPDDALYLRALPWIDELADSSGPTSIVARIHRLTQTQDPADANALVAWMTTANPIERRFLLRQCARLDTQSVIPNMTYRALVRLALPYIDGLSPPLNARCLADVLQGAKPQPLPPIDNVSKQGLPSGDATVRHAELLPNGLVVLATVHDVRLVDSSGTELLRFHVDSHDIVPPTRGGMVLVLEEVMDPYQQCIEAIIVHRLNPLTGDWRQWTKLTDIAPDPEYFNDVHDGLWWVALSDRVVAFDVYSEDANILITLPGIDAVRFIGVRNEGAVVQAQDKSKDVFEWRSPSWRLTNRYPFDQIPSPTLRTISMKDDAYLYPAAFDATWFVHARPGRIDILHNDTLHASFPVWT